MRTRIKAFINCLLIAGIFFTGSPALVQAEAISTEAMLAGAPVSTAHERVAAFLMRSDVQLAIKNYNVDPAEVRARIGSLSEEELQELAKQIDRAPAGGDAVGAVVGGILIIFLVLLVTDIMGFTKFYPFTRPIRR